MKLCFFEDKFRSRFDPLTLTRPVDQLRVGILTLAEKWTNTLAANAYTRSTRPLLKKLYPGSKKQDPTDSILWINPRYLPESDLLHTIRQLETQEALTDKENDALIAARLGSRESRELFQQGKHPDAASLTTKSCQTNRKIEYLWDLFLLNGDEITRDIELVDPQRAPTETLPGTITLQSPEEIYMEEGVTLEPGTIIIADDGPVYIGEGAKIMAGSVIRGPAAICEDSVLKMGAKIYEESTIGPVCKVAGEVNNCILHSYSNKGHEGFIGNSLFGQWCNLGADTNVSNLKNNYKDIDMRDWSSGEPIDSGQQFIGTIMGDHSKTAINTMLNTGTMCGVSCNIFASKFPPKIIPSFSWIGDSGRRVYQFDKALETMEKMMGRRDATLTENYIDMMKQVFDEAQGAS